MPCIENRNITYDLCDFLDCYEPRVTVVLLQFMFVPLIAVIIFTVLDRDNEDAKWFVFNTAILNLFLGVLWNGLTFGQGFLVEIWTTIVILWSMNRDLGHYGVFLLSFTRVFILYQRQVYKHFVTRRTLIIWISFYDLILITISYFIYRGYLYSIALPLEFFMLIGTFSCSLLVLMKIHQMIRLVKRSPEFSILNDLRKASIVCIFQNVFYAFYVLTILNTRIYYIVIGSTQNLSQETLDLLKIVFEVVNRFQNFLYLNFVIMDACIPMLLLRSYRNTIRRVGQKLYRFFSRQPISATVIVVTSKGLPKTNNFMSDAFR